MYDIIIRNGIIVDGTGNEPCNGDIAIHNGVIAAVGTLPVGTSTRREIDATGKIVTPGWVDVHSHMDGQATWDPLLSPAADHGITTLVMGNCGIGFAPCKPTTEDRDRLIAVVEDVEDIPGAALHEGVTWAWESFPEYLDALDRIPRAIDIAAQVPHCAVRTYVMGERGSKNEKATSSDILSMAQIVKQGIEAGAIGFTTSRTKLHTTRQGEVMPGTYADEDELLGIGKVIGELGKGTYGLVSDFDDWESEMRWMKKLSIENNCPVNFVLFFRQEEDWPRVLKQLEFVRDAKKDGAVLIPHVGARPVNILLGWDATVNPFLFHQRYGPIGALPREERLAKLRDSAVRKAILEETPPVIGEAFIDGFITGFDRIYVLGDQPNYEPDTTDSIAYCAEAAGKSPAEYAYDAMLENDGRNLLYYPAFGYDSGDLRRQEALLRDENTVISLADTGAHCGVLSDVSVPTFLLSHFVRDRKRGERFPLAWAVKLHTADTAHCIGLFDRGLLKPGFKADINVIDFERIRVQKPEVIYDLPAGGRRVFQGAEGYIATIVNGQVIYENGKPTGALPGKLVRGTRPEPRVA